MPKKTLIGDPRPYRIRIILPNPEKNREFKDFCPDPHAHIKLQILVHAITEYLYIIKVNGYPYTKTI